MKKRKKPHENCRRDQALSFRMRHHLCRQGVALAGTRQLRSEGSMPVHAHRTEGVTGSKGREEANWVGVEGGNGDEDGGGGRGRGGNSDENGGEGERKSARWERGRERRRGGNRNGYGGGDP